MISRIYFVNALKPRLVRANNKAQAIRHVANDLIDAKVADQDDLVRLIGMSVTVENATSDDVDKAEQGAA